MRLGDKVEAREALEVAFELESRNAFALRRLGSLLVIAGALAAGAERTPLDTGGGVRRPDHGLQPGPGIAGAV